jgi:hypothetical protein
LLSIVSFVFLTQGWLVSVGFKKMVGMDLNGFGFKKMVGKKWYFKDLKEMVCMGVVSKWNGKQMDLKKWSAKNGILRI